VFDWLVNGEVVPIDPAHSVRGPRHVMTELASVYRRMLLKLPEREREQLDKDEQAFVIAEHRCRNSRACIEPAIKTAFGSWKRHCRKRSNPANRLISGSAVRDACAGSHPR
jgi:hypothetical protein